MDGLTALGSVVIVGAGPAGLMAAEVLSNQGFQVDIYDAMPSAGRKFLQAGRGGLNITHSEDLSTFLTHYGDAQSWLASLLTDFGPAEVVAWVKDFGLNVFVGSSGRIFPEEKKAAPLLRRWIHRLRNNGVKFHLKSKLTQWLPDDNRIIIENEKETKEVSYQAIIFALGGASWPQLGSNGAWVSEFQRRSVVVNPLLPANCGFNVDWSDLMKLQAGKPLKPVVIHFNSQRLGQVSKKGEIMITQHGIEGSLIYPFSSELLRLINEQGGFTIHVDLMPDWDFYELNNVLAAYPKSRSLTLFFRNNLHLSDVKIALFYEVYKNQKSHATVAEVLKSLPIVIRSSRPISEAISTSGGVSIAQLNESLMMKDYPGCFCAGEMLDWDAPTGGYLLTAVLSMGVRVGYGVRDWCRQQ